MPNTPRNTVLCRYHYDPLDRQNGCTVFQQPVIQRFHCKNRLVTEIQGAVRWSILQHDDHLLAQHNHLDAKVTATLLATDQQRSVFNALDATQPNPLAYSPYGHRPAENGLLSLLGFNGEQPDPVTGHYHLGNGYRQFNPVLMRFNSPDSWSPFGKGGLNAYAYCGGNPISQRDPSGHFLIRAMQFDEVFSNSYLLMKDTNLGKIQLLTAVEKKVTSFGGATKLDTLAKATNQEPDAIIASALSERKKVGFLEELKSGENPTEYFSKANKHIKKTLKNKNISDELLRNDSRYSKYLNERQRRNLEASRLESRNELKRTVSYLLTLRIDGPSRAGSSFDANKWLKIASEIRK
jgi:RHS repeat-associated protein